jgi:hypothetical protein
MFRLAWPSTMTSGRGVRRLALVSPEIIYVTCYKVVKHRFVTDKLDQRSPLYD